MPYAVLRVGKGRYAVVNPATGQVHAKNTTKRRAQAQVRLLKAKEAK